jgi:nitroreductase
VEFFAAVKNRISVREYADKPIAKEKIEQIVDAGRLAPTARGEEPWEFIAVTEKKKIQELAALTDHGKFLAGAACALCVFCKETKYYLEDGCAATENLLLAAASLGIGSCWIAGDKKPYGADIAQALSVPPGQKLICLIALGYPKTKPTAHKKRLLHEVLHWEKY